MTAVATIAATVPVRVQERPAASGFEEDEEGADVIGAFVDSLKLLMIEHSFRIAFQDKTRRERNRVLRVTMRLVLNPGRTLFQCGGRQVSVAPLWEAAQLEVANGSHFRFRLARLRAKRFGVVSRSAEAETPNLEPWTACNTGRVSLIAVTAHPLDLEALIREVTGSRVGDGAVTSFIGLVRDHNQGRRVSFLDYEAYEPMAVRALNRIVDEIREAWPDIGVGVHHRTGRIEIGEASVIIVAVAPHRAHAFAACRYTIERIKQIVPIWKHEHFEGGDVWLEGATADPDDESARQAAYRIACA